MRHSEEKDLKTKQETKKERHDYKYLAFFDSLSNQKLFNTILLDISGVLQKEKGCNSENSFIVFKWDLAYYNPKFKNGTLFLTT